MTFLPADRRTRHANELIAPAPWTGSLQVRAIQSVDSNRSFNPAHFLPRQLPIGYANDFWLAWRFKFAVACFPTS